VFKQASLGPGIKVEGENNLHTRFWYYLTMCCPLIFEKYVVVLHPYWINYEVKKLIKAGSIIPNDLKKKYEFESLNWVDFFQNYGKKFDFDTALLKQEEIRKELLNPQWPEYVWFPAEGDLENKNLIAVRNAIKDTYGDVEVNYYYCLLKTRDIESEIIYKGKLSQLEQLWAKDDIRDNPTAIFPNSKEWCVVTDYDLPYTYIGGSNELIQKLLESKNLDIFSIEPRFAGL